MKSFRLILILALPAAALAQTSLTVDATTTVRTVDERVFGVNSVIWDGQAGSAQTISMVQAAGIRMIRVPGGSLSDDYHWRVNKSLNNTWTWSTSFNGFINLLTNTNTQPMVTVNYGSGTPEEAAGLVAYLNASTGTSVSIGTDSGTDSTNPNYQYNWQTSGTWAALRAASPLGSDDGMNFLRIGRASPVGAKYFEIGNECYGTWETDKQVVTHDPTTYANRVQQYITKMKAVDPTIKIGVVVVTSSENANYSNWTPTMLGRLKALGVTPDFVIYHLYPQAPGDHSVEPGNPLPTSPQAEHDATLLQVADTGSKSWATIASDLRTQVTAGLGAQAGAGVEIVVTENNNVYSSPGKQSTSLVNGLYLADSVANLMQTEINGYMWWALRNGPPTLNNGTLLAGNIDSALYGWRQFGDYGMLSSPSTLTGETTYYNPYPTYYMMKLLSHFARNGDTVVPASSPNSLLSIFAVKRTDGSLSLLVIDKTDPRVTATAQSTTIALTGFNPAATATVYSYGVPQDNAATDIATSSMSISGATFSASFAPYSATVISIAPLSVNAAPAITSQPASRSVNAGVSTTFAVGASGTPAPTFQWQKDNVDIVGATRDTYTILSATAADAGSYTVVATNASGSVASAAATLTVNNVPVTTAQPADQTVASGQTAGFTVSFSGTPVPTYQWQLLPAGSSTWANLSEGGSYTGTTTTTLNVSGTTTGMNGDKFRCVATNSTGSTTSNLATLIVMDAPYNAVISITVN